MAVTEFFRDYELLYMIEFDTTYRNFYISSNNDYTQLLYKSNSSKPISRFVIFCISISILSQLIAKRYSHDTEIRP